MSKRQAILLLGVFMANTWGFILYAPANSGRISVSEIKSNDDANSIWVKKHASSIANYLYKKRVGVVKEDDIAEAYKKIYGRPSAPQIFKNEDSMLYIEGAIQALIDNKLKIADNKVAAKVATYQSGGVDGWLHKHSQRLINYFESKDVTSIDNYAVVVKACNDLGITLLGAKREKTQQHILDSLNKSLNDSLDDWDKWILPEDKKFADEILSDLRLKDAHNVDRSQFLQTARKLSLPSDFINRIDAMPKSKMEVVLQELNKELDRVSKSSLDRGSKSSVSRALMVFAQVEKKNKEKVERLINLFQLIGNK